MSPLFPVGAEGRVAWDTENVSRVAPGAACRVSGEYVVFCVLYIRRHSVSDAGSQGRQETASLYAGGIRAVIAVTVTADCWYCTYGTVPSRGLDTIQVLYVFIIGRHTVLICRLQRRREISAVLCRPYIHSYPHSRGLPVTSGLFLSRPAPTISCRPSGAAIQHRSFSRPYIFIYPCFSSCNVLYPTACILCSQTPVFY